MKRRICSNSGWSLVMLKSVGAITDPCSRSILLDAPWRRLLFLPSISTKKRLFSKTDCKIETIFLFFDILATFSRRILMLTLS